MATSPINVCQYCSNSYSDPRVLDCLHSYCLQCITTIHDEEGTTNSSITCPSCHHSTPIPNEGGMASLPANIRLACETEQDCIVKKVMTSPSPPCESCDGSSPSVAYCKDCKDMLCSECWRIHQEMKKTKSHPTYSLDDLRKKPHHELVKMISPSIPMCPHHGKVFDFYCTKCSVPVCVECTVDRHCKDNGHTIEEIGKHVLQHKANITCDVEGLSGKKNELEEVAKQINVSKTKIRDSKNQIEDMLREAFSELRRLIDQREAELLFINTEIASSKEMRLSTQEKDIQQLMESIIRCLSVSSIATSEYSNVQLLAIADSLHTGAIELQRRFTAMPFDPYDTPLITADFNTDELKILLPRFGGVVDLSSDGPNCSAVLPRQQLALGATMHVEVITRNKQKEVLKVGGATVRGKLSYNGGVIKDSLGITNNGDGTYRVDVVTDQKIGQHQLSITVNGQHIQGSPFNLDIVPQRNYTNLSKPVHKITGIKYPRCVAFSDNGNMFVTSYGDYRIHVYDASGNKINTIGSDEGKSELHFQYPFGIDISGEVVYVAERNGHRIHQFTTNGKLIGVFGGYGSAIGQFSNPYDVKISPDDKVYVADTDNHRIQVFDRYWSLSHVIDGRESGHGHFELPHCIRFDLFGDVHVCGHGSSSVTVFTSSGQFVRKYGNRGNIDAPWGLAIDSSGNCLVSSYEKSTLTIFDSNGKLLHRKKGFDYCRDISLSPIDGSLWFTNSYYEYIMKYSY